MMSAVGISACVGLFACLAPGFGAEWRPKGPLPLGPNKPVDFAGLHNVIRVSEKIYSGGVPEGDAGFQALKKLGIKTILTVDGAKPEVDKAKALGMRYVHLPFGYDSCPTPTANAIAKAVKDLPGPVYIHCHHGKNRSPVAAAVAAKALDGISDDEAESLLVRAGAGKNYTGLYNDVRNYKAPTPAEWERLIVKLPETAKTPPLVDAMVAIEGRHAKLLKLQKDGWKPVNGIDPAYEALQLQELYTELNRTVDIKKRPADYRKWMAEAEIQGKALETALRAGNTDEAGMKLGLLTVGCGSCHTKYRNVPQR
jgi:protein tyrosine phosphatase (PTP) superfamily phosphohydrolase (DUF442 family)